MIAYDLKCGNGHTFEGWFEDSLSFASQNERGLIACPVCNDSEIVRLPSRFAIKSSPAPLPQKESDSREEQLRAQIGKEVVEFVQKNFDNVGCDFAKEALKIHYGVSEPRNIRGVSTQQEENLLKQEGISFFKLPMPAGPDTDS
jgi:hypothetical protein